jgi:hypothetical protein
VRPTWCAKSSPDELLQRQNLVSVTWLACEKLRSAQDQGGG